MIFLEPIFIPHENLIYHAAANYPIPFHTKQLQTSPFERP